MATDPEADHARPSRGRARHAGYSVFAGFRFVSTAEHARRLVGSPDSSSKAEGRHLLATAHWLVCQLLRIWVVDCWHSDRSGLSSRFPFRGSLSPRTWPSDNWSGSHLERTGRR